MDYNDQRMAGLRSLLLSELLKKEEADRKVKEILPRIDELNLAIQAEKDTEKKKKEEEKKRLEEEKKKKKEEDK